MEDYIESSLMQTTVIFDEMFFIESITQIVGEDQWRNRVYLVALENGIIGHIFRMMLKNLSPIHE